MGCQIGLFYTLPPNLKFKLGMEVSCQNSSYIDYSRNSYSTFTLFLHFQEDTDSYSEAYVSISYNSVEYRKLLKKVSEIMISMTLWQRTFSLGRGLVETNTNI